VVEAFLLGFPQVNLMTQLVEHLHNLFPLRSFSKPARLFLIAVVIDGIIYSAWMLFFNLFILAQGYDKTFMGLVNSVPSIATLVLGIPLGMLSDRIGRRPAMLLGLAVNTAGSLLIVLSRTPDLLVAASFLAGIGSTLYVNSQAPFMMKASNASNRALLFSLSFGLNTLSGTVGSLFAGQLPALFGGLFHVAVDSTLAYQMVLLCSVVLGSCSLIPVFFIKEPPSAVAALQNPLRSLIGILRKRIYWLLFLPNLLIGIGAAILIPYMNVFFSETYQYTAEALGAMFSLSALLTGLGSIIGPRIAERLGSKIKTVVWTQGLSLGFLLLIGLSPFGWLAVIGFLARGTLMNMANPLYSAFAMEITTPTEQGAVNSLLSISWTVGWAVGPFISGLVQDHYGFTPLFVATALLYGTSTSLVWLFFHRREQQLIAAGEQAV
jgi:MFS family permease